MKTRKRRWTGLQEKKRRKKLLSYHKKICLTYPTNHNVITWKLLTSYLLAAKWGKYFALGKSSEFFLLFSDAQGKTDNLSTGSKIFVLVRNIVWFSWSPEYFTCTTKEGIMVGGNHGDRVETMETIWLLSWRRGQHELDSNSQWMHWWETPCAALTRLTTEVVYSTIFVTSGRSE